MTDAILAALFVGASLTSPYHVPVASTATQQTELPVSGLATYYNPGIMDEVVATRTAWGQLPKCPDCLGHVAMLWPGDLGRVVCVEAGGVRFGPYLVADVAASHHRDALLEKNWVLDADRPVWESWGFPNSPTAITVEDC